MKSSVTDAVATPRRTVAPQRRAGEPEPPGPSDAAGTAPPPRPGAARRRPRHRRGRSGSPRPPDRPGRRASRSSPSPLRNVCGRRRRTRWWCSWRSVKTTATLRVHVIRADPPFKNREQWSAWTCVVSACSLELSRLGSMRAVAETHDLTTSTVSQQIAALAREVGTPLVEPDGRRVRLTPAGRPAGRPRRDDPGRGRRGPGRPRPGRGAGRHPPGGRVRDRGPGLAAARDGRARGEPPAPCGSSSSEHEPLEAFALLADDDLDLALTYDYNLAPGAAGRDDGGGTALDDGVGPRRAGGRRRPTSPVRDLAVWSDARLDRQLAQHRGRDGRCARWPRWPASPRGSAHRIDSLDLVEDLIVAGRGIGLLPAGRSTGARGPPARAATTRPSG